MNKRQVTEAEYAAAYVVLFANQYSDDACDAHAALLDVSAALARGEHIEARVHGELDGLIDAVRKRRAALAQTSTPSHPSGT